MKDFTNPPVWEQLEEQQRDPLEEKPINYGWLIALVLILVVIAAIVTTGYMRVGWLFFVEPEQYAVVQTYKNDLAIVEAPGYHTKMPWLEQVTHYPRYITFSFIPIKDNEINCVFEDSGTAKIGVGISLGMPLKAEERAMFFRKVRTIENLEELSRAVAVNCIKGTAPIFTTEEVLYESRAEFERLIEEQFVRGPYRYRRINAELDGKSIIATEIELDQISGEPVVAQKAPWSEIGVYLQALHITSIDPDAETMALIKQKRLKRWDAALREQEQEAKQIADAKLKNDPNS